MMSLHIKNVSYLDQSTANVVSLLRNRSGVTEHTLRTELGISHDRVWTVLKNLEANGWVKRVGSEYYSTERACRINIYDPAAERLIGHAARLLLITIKDYGPISIVEACRIAGVAHGTATRRAPVLQKMGLIKPDEKGLWTPSHWALEMDPLSLWPCRENIDAMKNFIECAKLSAPKVIILFDRSIAAVTEALAAEDIYTFGQAVAACLHKCEVKPEGLIISSKHAWLNEIHRIHYPPSLKLRKAMLGLPVWGEKPKHDFVEIYKLSTHFAPLTTNDIEQWTRKRWLTRTDTGATAYTTRGIEITRKLRAATKVFHETMKTPQGVAADFFFA